MAIRVLILIILFILNSLASMATGNRIQVKTNGFVTGIYRSTSGVYYCGTYDNGILRSTDNGASWTTHAGPSDPLQIECASRIQTNDDKYVVVFVYDIERSAYTLLSSSDSCKSWTAIIPGNESPMEATKAILLKNNKTIVLNAKNALSVLDSGATSTKPLTVVNSLTAHPIDFSVARDGSIFILLDNGSIVKMNPSDLGHVENVEFVPVANDRPIKFQVTETGKFYVYTEKYNFFLLSSTNQPEELNFGVPDDGQKYVFEIASASDEYFVAKYNNDLTDFNVFDTRYYRKSTNSKTKFYESAGTYNEATLDFYFSDNCMYFNVAEYSNPQIGQFIYSIPFGSSTAIGDEIPAKSGFDFSFNSQVNPTSINISGAVQMNSLRIDAYDETGNKLDVVGLIDASGNASLGLNSSRLASGVYFITIGNGESKVTKKFIRI